MLESTVWRNIISDCGHPQPVKFFQAFQTSVTAGYQMPTSSSLCPSTLFFGLVQPFLLINSTVVCEEHLHLQLLILQKPLSKVTNKLGILGFCVFVVFPQGHWYTDRRSWGLNYHPVISWQHTGWDFSNPQRISAMPSWSAHINEKTQSSSEREQHWLFVQMPKASNLILTRRICGCKLRLLSLSRKGRVVWHHYRNNFTLGRISRWVVCWETFKK